MIDSLVKLIEHGTKLLRESERQKKLFFEEVVKPTQTSFETLYHDHLKTFDRARTMVLDKDCPAADIAEFVRTRILFEQGTTELLLRLTKVGHSDDWRRTPKRGELEDRFNAYIACIAGCLISPDVEVGPPQVSYYLALSDVFSTLAGTQISNERRLRATAALDRILLRFQYFYGDVSARFIELQRYCST